MLVVLSHIALLAQDREGSKGSDFIITIDGDIVKTIYRPEIVILDSGTGVKSVPISYHPGALSLAKNDRDHLLSLDDSIKLLLKFEYNEYTTRGNQKVLNYEIEIGKEWLEQAYMILHIYNTDKKPYKGKLKPIPGKNYTFELDYPGGQMIRLRKK
ncbi:hypothetical protein SAMN05421747_1393 [Parapedobacter composti]|uniref:Uncharacterized protein n=2 Tax=Parapedobacter composti TaxID=623281 RepID=A0A1I1MQE2_9SPHI|nr:hypothetical protein SAMN05421747_1393 [Parapedobacter composti]